MTIMSRKKFKREAQKLPSGGVLKARILRNNTEGLGGYRPLEELARLLRKRNSVTLLCTESSSEFFLEAFKV